MGDLSHRQDREDLAAALRMAARQNWQSGICNHFSLAAAATHFLIEARLEACEGDNLVTERRWNGRIRREMM
jgi:ribulose-5-phosphate 4-epimerase/fuculose-1-phosphate aldolase